MEMKAVQSAAIAAYGYDEATETLAVTFVSGQTYRYSGVPADIAAGFGAAQSVSAYWRHNIRSHFVGVKQDDEQQSEGE